MKKVIVLSSSPRKGGNSDTLCDKFIEGAVSAGHEVEKIFIRDCNIHPCMGCGFCTHNDYSGCAKSDDMDGIMEHMMAADVIVFSTPVYFCTMTGQLKIFIDRLLSQYQRITNKEYYLLITAKNDTQEEIKFVLGEFKGVLSCFPGSVFKGYLFAGGVWHRGEINNTDYPQRAFNLGKSI